MKPELPLYNLEQQKVAQLRRQIGEYAARTEYFSSLSPNLKRIAEQAAIEAIMLDETALRARAGELDTLAIENPFARADREASGGILDQDIKLRRGLANSGIRPLKERLGIANDQLRQAVASRQARICLAAELGCEPGQWEEIATREDFKAADNLAWQSTREFGSK